MRSCVRSRRQPSAAPAGQGLESTGYPSFRFSVRRWRGLTGSWGTPCTHALLSDPGGTSAPGHLGAAMLPSAFRDGVGSHDDTVSGLNHTACVLAVYASQPWSPVATQDSLPAAGQLCRAGLITRWVPSQSFRAAPYISSSLPRLSPVAPRNVCQSQLPCPPGQAHAKRQLLGKDLLRQHDEQSHA